VFGTAAGTRHAINAIVKAPAIIRFNSALSQDTPLACHVRGRPWKSHWCAPTVVTVHTGRPNSPDARPLYVRGQRNMTVYSATRGTACHTSSLAIRRLSDTTPSEGRFLPDAKLH
jgi:hypothetical protein